MNQGTNTKTRSNRTTRMGFRKNTHKRFRIVWFSIRVWSNEHVIQSSALLLVLKISVHRAVVELMSHVFIFNWSIALDFVCSHTKAQIDRTSCQEFTAVVITVLREQRQKFLFFKCLSYYFLHTPLSFIYWIVIAFPSRTCSTVFFFNWVSRGGYFTSTIISTEVLKRQQETLFS